MNGSIVCGVDDSESAQGAARVARELGARLGLRLVFVRVVDDGSSEGEIGAIAGRLRELAEGASGAGGGARWLVEAGHPADRLVAAAADENAALLVLGSTGPRSSLLGSISADVSRRAPCPVVVVAPGADRPLANGRGGPEADPGLADDGYAGVDGVVRLGMAGRSAGGAEPGARDFAGGIARFALGSAKKG
jgi:nucleotide-binding universal stress UspA family protein